MGGAWVGGEYRCIHFRTGQLGQGSRTALPIFGYFMQDVLSDPNFAKYQQKFKKPLEDIPSSCYEFENYRPHPREIDSLTIDSINNAFLGDSLTFSHPTITQDEVEQELSGAKNEEPLTLP